MGVVLVVINCLHFYEPVFLCSFETFKIDLKYEKKNIFVQKFGYNVIVQSNSKNRTTAFSLQLTLKQSFYFIPIRVDFKILKIPNSTAFYIVLISRIFHATLISHTNVLWLSCVMMCLFIKLICFMSNFYEFLLSSGMS